MGEEDVLEMMSDITIDGSFGEGGGQIIRTTIALSALTMKPVKIINIRAGRSKPGLRRQHIAGVDLTGKLVNAEITGLEIGSTTLKFVPIEKRCGQFRYDVGTAGAISLVIQAIIPAAVLSPDRIQLDIIGGTDVAWSPPIDYIREVFLPMLTKIGPSVEIIQNRRGHYPKGGGRVSCMITPVSSISHMEIIERENISRIGGISHCVRLPSHVATRQAKSAKSLLTEIADVDIVEESYQKGKDPHLGPGSGIVLWGEDENGIRIGSDSLGERGKLAEDVGSEAAKQLREEIAVGRAIDSHLCDMLVPFLAIASSRSRIGITKVTSHLKTNLWVIEQILGVKSELVGEIGEPGILEINGIGLTPR